MLTHIIYILLEKLSQELRVFPNVVRQNRANLEPIAKRFLGLHFTFDLIFYKWDYSSINLFGAVAIKEEIKIEKT